MPRVTLMLSAKVGGKWSFFRASIAGNGRVEPAVAIVNERRRTLDDGNCGGYFIRYTRPDGKQTYESAGKDPAGARARQIAKQAELEGNRAGISMSAEAPQQKKTHLSSCRFNQRIQQLYKREQTHQNLDGVQE